MRPDTSFLRQHAVVSIAVALAVAMVATGLLARRSQAEQLRESAALQSLPLVKLVQPASVAAGALELPARLEAWARAPIHARVSGYLKRWTVDIGERVKAGQLLAEIETPELDKQLAQVRAEAATAKSSAALAESTARRWQSLAAVNFVSKQGVEEKSGDLEVKQSMVNALQANVERVQALKRDSRLVAPFDGVVTARNTDVGALINEGGSPDGELFVISDVSRLRVYVSVPQRQVGAIHVGGNVQLLVPERPGRVYAATVHSMSRAIESGSGAMLVQLTVDNKSGDLLPGSFAKVRFDASGTPAGISVPPSALMIGKEGVRVATADAQGRVQLKAVTIARDFGKVIELGSGLSPGDRVIDSPPDGLADGDRVRIADAGSAPSGVR
jgi:RND family efflux transporter MFP subunit